MPLKQTALQSSKKPPIIFIVGPTAVGKTEVAVRLAKRINAEIISCDSMQLYRHMDIISSKPSQAQRKGILHHLIDAVSPLKEYDVAMFRKAALKKIGDILKKKKNPLFVGGTGLYLSILIDGIFDIKIADEKIRKRLYREAERFGSAYLHARLKKADPQAAEKVHSRDTKRIVRALEVFQATGRPISELQKKRIGLSDKYDIKIFCLTMSRDRLYKRIDERVDKMFKNGLMGEAKRLFKLKLSRTASCAIGLRELKGHFDGQYDLEEAKRLMKRNTRRYAKRQLTWFRKDARIKWVNVDTAVSSAKTTDEIFNKL